MKTLIIQKRFGYAPRALHPRRAEFISDIQGMVRKARERYKEEELELAEIGFLPAAEHVEVKLYFRKPET